MRRGDKVGLTLVALVLGGVLAAAIVVDINRKREAGYHYQPVEAVHEATDSMVAFAFVDPEDTGFPSVEAVTCGQDGGFVCRVPRHAKNLDWWVAEFEAGDLRAAPVLPARAPTRLNKLWCSDCLERAGFRVRGAAR